jgi:hypothetical protein
MLVSGGARSFTITDLEEGGSYTFGLTAINGAGTSPENSTTTQTPPAGTFNCCMYYADKDLKEFMFVIMCLTPSSNWCSKKSSSYNGHANQFLDSVGWN